MGSGSIIPFRIFESNILCLGIGRETLLFLLPGGIIGMAWHTETAT